MTELTPPSLPQLEAIVSSAVDRQIDEQRSLQTTLAELGSAVGEVREALRAVAEGLRAQTEAVQELGEDLRAQQLRLEDRVTDLATTVLEGLRELAGTQQAALESLAAAVSSAPVTTSKEIGTLLRDGIGSLSRRVDGLAERVSEATEISEYLRDQADDLDRLLQSLNEVPSKLEAVIAQAMRRGLTVRAGLMQEAEHALEQALGPVEDRVRELVRELGLTRRSGGRKGQEDDGGGRSLSDEMHRLNLRQVELTTRIDDLHASLLGALESLTAGPAQPLVETVHGTEPPRASAGPRTRGPRRKTKAPSRTAAPKKTAAAKGSRSTGAKTSRRTRTSEPEPAAAEQSRPRRRAGAAPPEPPEAETAAPARRVPQPSRRRRTYIPV